MHSDNDLRRARSAAQNIVPTTTGAAKACGVVLPELNGKIHGMSFRVPTSTGSVTDLVANLKRDVTVDEVNDAYRAAVSGSLAGIMDYTDEPLVSSDFIRNPHSSIIDGLSTMSMAGNMGQDRRLVRQRVGLQLQDRRPRGVPVRQGPVARTRAV